MNHDGICYENLTATWLSTTKRRKIHSLSISPVIKILTLGTGPGDYYTLLEESGLVMKKDRLGVENGGRNGIKMGVGMV